MAGAHPRNLKNEVFAGEWCIFVLFAYLQVKCANVSKFRSLGPSKSKLFGPMLASKPQKMKFEMASKKHCKKDKHVEKQKIKKKNVKKWSRGIRGKSKVSNFVALGAPKKGFKKILNPEKSRPQDC